MPWLGPGSVAALDALISAVVAVRLVLVVQAERVQARTEHHACNITVLVQNVLRFVTKGRTIQ